MSAGNSGKLPADRPVQRFGHPGTCRVHLLLLVGGYSGETTSAGPSRLAPSANRAMAASFAWMSASHSSYPRAILTRVASLGPSAMKQTDQNSGNCLDRRLLPKRPVEEPFEHLPAPDSVRPTVKANLEAGEPEGRSQARWHSLVLLPVCPVPRVRVDVHQGGVRKFAGVQAPNVTRPVAAREVAAALVDAVEAGRRDASRTSAARGPNS